MSAVFAFACFLLAFCLSSVANAQNGASMFIRDVQLLDFSGSAPAFVPAAAVLIADGRIIEVGRTSEIEPPIGALILDGRGRFLMPGLVDMHVHLWDEAALGAYLAHGVTTIRNASGMPFHLRLARRIEEGTLLGPRLFTTGPILNGEGPNAQVNHQIVRSAAEARAAIRAQHAAGFRHVKLYSNLSREAYEAIREEAHLLGMSIMGHSPEGVRKPGLPHTEPFDIAFQGLLGDGFVTFEHMETIVWHGLRDRHDEAAARQLAEEVAAAGAVVDPTLLAFYNLVRVAETGGAYLSRPGVETLNPLLVAQEQPDYERWSGEAAAPARAAFDFYKRAVRIFADAGVLLVAGSDAGIFTNPPGQSLVDELRLLVDAGLSPFQALRAATHNAAVALGEPDQAGRIAAGFRADLLLLASNPLAEIEAVGRPDAVIAQGRLFEQAELASLLEAARHQDIERTRRNVFAGLRTQGVDPAALGASPQP